MHIRKLDRGTVNGVDWKSLLAVFLSAGLFFLSFPGMPAPWLAWVAFVPLFCSLRRPGLVRGALLAGAMGWLIWFSSVWWLFAPLRDILGMPAGVALTLTMGGCVLLALPYLVAGGVVVKWIPPGGLAGATGAAAVFTLATVGLGLVFQGHIAHSQYRYPVVLQVLELGGAPLLLFAIYWVNWLIADSLHLFRSKERSGLKMAGGALIVLCLVLGYGVIRLQQVDAEMKAADAERWVMVGAVQPNIPTRVSEKHQLAPASLRNTFFTAMEQARVLAAAHPDLELIVLPENPETFFFNHDRERRQALGQMIGATGVPVVLNVDAEDAPEDSGEPGGRYNLAVLVNANRDLAGSYVKMKRLPLVEYLPGEALLPWLRKLFPASLRVVEGPGPALFHVNENVRVIPLICYEGTMSSFSRAFVREGGNLVVNQTNDSWFLRTRASEIHLALALFRSVENRVPMVRVTNSGTGAHIQANGSIVPGSKTDLFVESATAFPLYLPPKRSLYASIGNLWMIALVLYLIVILVKEARRQEVKEGKQPQI